jgi:ubiquinone biosynthesis protein
MLSELDFRNENNLTQFRRLFRHNQSVRIPQPEPRLCSSRVLTMERLDGVKLSELNGSGRYNRDRLARRGAQLYLRMMFEHGFFHADPHPGNILILDDDVIGLLDFGLVGRINESLRNDVQTMLYSMVSDDLSQLIRVIRRVNCPWNWMNPNYPMTWPASLGATRRKTLRGLRRAPHCAISWASCEGTRSRCRPTSPA